MCCSCAVVFVLFPALLSGSGARASTFLLPPADLVESFMLDHELIGMEIRVSLTRADVPALVDYRRNFGYRPASVANSSVGASAVSAAGKCRLRCDIRNLRLVPRPTTAAIDEEWSSALERAFRQRDHADVDFWLIGTPFVESGDLTTSARSLASSLPLDLDDRVYLYFPLDDDGAMTVLEAYKVLPSEEPTILKYADWSPDGGFRYASEEGIWERRRDMQSVKLKVSSLRYPPYIYWLEFGERRLGEPVKMTGMFADVFHTLQEIMNFTYILGSPEDLAYGVNLGDNVWNGMVGQLQRKEIDMAPTDFTVTSERAAVMTFSTPITQIYHHLFIPNPAETPHYTAYIEPLDKWVWLVLTLIIAMSPPFLYAAINFGPLSENAKLKSEFTLGKSYVFTASVMTFMRPWNVVPSQLTGRLAFGILLIAGTLTYYHWEAMLVSYLSTKVIVLPFRSLAELISSTDFKIALLADSYYEDLFKFSQDPLWQEAWTERIEPDIDTYPKSEELVDYVLHRPDFAFYDNFFAVRTYAAYTDCTIIAVPKKFDIKPYAFGFQQDSALLGMFNYYLNQMRERGSMKKISDTYESKAQECPDYSGKPLGLETCFTAFGLLLFGLFLCSVLFLTEACLMVGGKACGKDLRHLETYGIAGRNIHLDEDGVMADPNLDERVKYIIQEKNARLDEMENLLEKHIQILGSSGSKI